MMDETKTEIEDKILELLSDSVLNAQLCEVLNHKEALDFDNYFIGFGKAKGIDNRQKVALLENLIRKYGYLLRGGK